MNTIQHKQGQPLDTHPPHRHRFYMFCVVLLRFNNDFCVYYYLVKTCMCYLFVCFNVSLLFSYGHYFQCCNHANKAALSVAEKKRTEMERGRGKVGGGEREREAEQACES